MGTASHSSPHLSESVIQAFLARLGERYEKPATLYLLGGSALLLLGSPRPTIDIDYLGTDIPSQMEELQLTIRQVADEMHIDVEAIPFQDFIPLPQDAQQRHVSVGQFGKLTAYVFDPYSIALSKITRLDTGHGSRALVVFPRPEAWALIDGEMLFTHLAKLAEVWPQTAEVQVGPVRLVVADYQVWKDSE